MGSLNTSVVLPYPISYGFKPTGRLALILKKTHPFARGLVLYADFWNRKDYVRGHLLGSTGAISPHARGSQFSGGNYIITDAENDIDSATGAAQDYTVIMYGITWTLGESRIVIEKGIEGPFYLQTNSNGSVTWKIDGSTFLFSNAVMNDGISRVITMVRAFGSNEAKIYINGVVDNTGTAVTGASDNNADLTIGSRNGILPYNGECGCALLYNRALHADEVRAITFNLYGCGLVVPANDRAFVYPQVAPPAGNIARQHYHHRHHNRSA